MKVASRLKERLNVTFIVEVETEKGISVSLRQIELKAIRDQFASPVRLTQRDTKREARAGFEIEMLVCRPVVEGGSERYRHPLPALSGLQHAVDVVPLADLGFLS